MKLTKQEIEEVLRLTTMVDKISSGGVDEANSRVKALCSMAIKLLEVEEWAKKEHGSDWYHVPCQEVSEIINREIEWE